MPYSSDIIDFVAEHRVVAKAVFENRGEGNLIDRVLAYLHATYHESWEQANPGMSGARRWNSCSTM